MDNYNDYSANPNLVDAQGYSQSTAGTKICSNCGATVAETVAFCTKCGASMQKVQPQQPQYQQTQPQYQQVQPQYQQMPVQQPTIIIQNTNTNTNTNNNAVTGFMKGRERNKWVALLLCILLGWLGAHKFYENKTGMGILYLFTFGLFGIGIIIDFISIICKPVTYYV